MNLPLNNTALSYSLGTVLCWGGYSVLLHMGAQNMGKEDPTGARMKAFLFVGIAYVLVAVVAPLVVLKSRGTIMNLPTAGWALSLVAGIAGAVGAFFLLMALSSGTNPAESKLLPLIVPAIVFAGAPIVNTIISTTKEGNWGHVNWKFVAGVILAMVGTAMVMRFKPAPPGAPTPAKLGEAKAAAAAGGRAVIAVGSVDVTTRSYHVS